MSSDEDSSLANGSLEASRRHSPHPAHNVHSKDDSSASPPRRRTASAANDLPSDKDEDHESNGIPGLTDDHDDGGDADLFGSDAESAGAGTKRKLDDAELDSGDDEGRDDRLAHTVEEDYAMDDEGGPMINIMESDLSRLPQPASSDGELYLLRVPHFLGINPTEYRRDTYQAPITDHHSSDLPRPGFSPLDTAKTSVHWRYDPNDPSKLQSTAQIIRWSDGSLTLQLATNPTEQYLIQAKPLAPPQINPTIPTPTAIYKDKAPPNTVNYDPAKDSHTYLTAPYESASLVRTTSHFTASLSVTTSDQNDDALARLQESMAAAVRGKKPNVDGGLGLIDVTEDPELAKKKAEAAERDKIRAQRRREQQIERERDRANRVLGRSGLRVGGGLTVGGLEDDDGMVTTKARGATKPKKRAVSRRGEIYSDDDEGYGGRGGRTREDEYDEDDGFLVGDDDEPEMVDDEEDEEEEEEDELGDVNIEKPSAAKSQRERASPPREAARGDAAVVGRKQRRRVVEDEDEE